MDINVQILVVGHKLEESKFDLPNLIVNIAECTIYQNYIRNNLKGKFTNANTLWVDFRFNTKAYLNVKNRCNFLDTNKTDQLLVIL